MTELFPGVSIIVAGALGGLLNGVTTHNLFLWPRPLPPCPPLRIVRPGLFINVLIGIVAAIGTFRALTGAWTLAGTAVNYWIALATAAILGGLAARLVTQETDKRLLRAALLKACAAPAAHPDLATVMASAPAHAVLDAATDLTPRFRSLR